jgi:cell division cycle 2-like protein
VLRLREVVWGVDAHVVFLVLDYYAYDLRRLLERNQWRATLAQSKWLVWQMLEALSYLHDSCRVLHRDLKSENVLIDAQGALVLADFGLARPCERRSFSTPSLKNDDDITLSDYLVNEEEDAYSSRPYTPLVVTLWYRAPELLLGTPRYSAAVDVWSLGCIVAELLKGHVLFAAASELNQLERIHDVLGTPTPERWPDFASLPGCRALLFPTPARLDQLGHVLPGSSPETLALLRLALNWDPKQRSTATQLLTHAWWHETPHTDAKINLTEILSDRS